MALIDVASPKRGVDVSSGDVVDFENTGNQTLTATFPISPFPPGDPYQYTVAPGGYNPGDTAAAAPGRYAYTVTTVAGLSPFAGSNGDIIIRGGLAGGKHQTSRRRTKKVKSKQGGAGARKAKAKKGGKGARKTTGKKVGKGARKAKAKKR